MKGIAMLYRPSTTGATVPDYTLSGRNLAHARRTVPERAFVAAKLHLNRIAVTDPTVKQCAAWVGVCAAYVASAVEIIDDPDVCDAVLRGDINIIDAAKRATVESLADHMRRSTPAELAAAAKVAGIDLVWDAMLAPNL
jgi:hypothetical protein